MSVASNRVSGRGIWGMTVDHTVMMIRDPDLVDAPIFICLGVTEPGMDLAASEPSLALDINEAGLVLVLERRECE